MDHYGLLGLQRGCSLEQVATQILFWININFFFWAIQIDNSLSHVFDYTGSSCLQKQSWRTDETGIRWRRAQQESGTSKS